MSPLHKAIFVASLSLSSSLFAQPALMQSFQHPVEERRPQLDYPKEYLIAQREGWVVLEYCVSPQGKVHSIQILDSSGGNGFKHAATQAIKTTPFQPASENGVPQEQCGMRYAFTFKLSSGLDDRRRLASGKTVRQYEQLNAALMAGDIAAAQGTYDDMMKRSRLNLYELAVLDFSKARIALAKGDREEALTYFNRADVDRGLYLDKQTYSAVLVQRYLLNYQLQRFGDTLAVYEELQVLEEKPTNFAAIQKATEDLQAQFASNQIFEIPVELNQEGIWRYTLFRNKLSFRSAAGGEPADDVTLSCQKVFQHEQNPRNRAPIYHKSEMFEYDRIWSLEDSLKSCTVAVKGKPGQKFSMLQHPN